MAEPFPTPVPERLLSAGQWVLTIGLAATLAWTTLCLGGYRPETMVVAGSAVMGLSILAAVLSAWRPINLDWVTGAPVPFLLFALASVRWLAPAGWLAWREWLLWLQMALVFWLARHFARSRAQTSVLVGTMIGLGVAGAAMAVYQRYVDPRWLMLGRTQAEQFWTRSAGMFGIPNSLAGLLELMLPGCLLVLGARRVSAPTKVLAGWLAAGFGLALVLTGSRGGWLAVTAALVLWPLLSAGDRRRRLVGVGLVAVGVVAVVFCLDRCSAAAHERLAPFWAGKFEQTRPVIWRVGVELWRSRPWLGTGAASYNVLFEGHRPAGFLNEPQWAHNDYLNTLSDYGLIGFALWGGVGAIVLWRGWLAVAAARRVRGAGAWFGHWRWKLGLWLGLVAYAVHLTVDFHTKIPALAYAAALAAGLLLRPVAPEEPDAGRVEALRRWGAVLAAGVLAALLCLKVWPLYRAEAARYGARQALDKQAATGQGSLSALLAEAQRRFALAVALDPGNGQAWSDLAYVTILGWERAGVSVRETGRRAQVAADRAIARCPELAEFWVRRGVALDMQGEVAAGEQSLRRAVALAPRNPEWCFYLAYHYAAVPGRAADARRVVETCLSLDPNYGPAIGLRDRLLAQQR